MTERDEMVVRRQLASVLADAFANRVAVDDEDDEQTVSIDITPLERDVVVAALRSAARPDDAGFEALVKINTIRNSIIGTQTLNWSEHVHPLVAALEAAGFKGMGYPKAREYFGTLVERAVRAEEALDAIAALPAPGGITTGWQDIETAPHNTRVILAWRDWRDDAWLMEVGPATTGQRFENGYSNLSKHGSATHWQPLPPAPTITRKSQSEERL